VLSFPNGAAVDDLSRDGTAPELRGEFDDIVAPDPPSRVTEQAQPEIWSGDPAEIVWDDELPREIEESNRAGEFDDIVAPSRDEVEKKPDSRPESDETSSGSGEK